jgi:hypothetical protein
MQMWWLMPLGLAIWKAEIGVLLDHKSLRPAWAIYRYSCLKKKKNSLPFRRNSMGKKILRQNALGCSAQKIRCRLD